MSYSLAFRWNEDSPDRSTSNKNADVTRVKHLNIKAVVHVRIETVYLVIAQGPGGLNKSGVSKQNI